MQNAFLQIFADSFASSIQHRFITIAQCKADRIQWTLQDTKMHCHIALCSVHIAYCTQQCSEYAHSINPQFAHSYDYAHNINGQFAHSIQNEQYCTLLVAHCACIALLHSVLSFCSSAVLQLCSSALVAHRQHRF